MMAKTGILASEANESLLHRSHVSSMQKYEVKN